MEGARLLQAAGRGLEAEALVKDWSIVVTAEISGRAALFAEGTDLNDEFEFEEHSLPLPPKEFLDIATCPECTMDALPESAVDVFTRLIPAVPTPPIPKLFGLRPLPDAINEAHRTNVTIPEIRVYSVIQAKVFGDSHIIRDDLVVSAPDIMPPYVRYFYNNGLVGVKSGKWPKERVTSGPVYLVTNFNTDQYGHFLLESLPRLFIAKLLYDDGFRFPILIPSTFPEFARRIATMLHKDFEFLEFEVQRDIILADRVLLPSMCHTDYIFHPCFLEFLRSLASDIIFTSKKAKLPDVSEVNRRRIFISRSRIRAGVSSFRAMQNYDEIETIARSRGFEIIHPQEMSWTEQVAMFANADFIVGEYGSGLHNALFARPGTCVLSINWLNGVQQHIARSCGHHIGFVLPDDNMPRSFSNDPSERQYFNVHPQHFSASLDNMLSENPLLVRV